MSEPANVRDVVHWPAALDLARQAVADPDTTAKAVAEAVRAGECFQNRDFPLSPVPVLVRAERAEELCPLLADYGRLLGRIVRLYREDPDVRAWFGLGPTADALVDADRGLPDQPWVCRLDGYLEEGTESLRLLENNADAPAGTLFTARINETVRRVGLGDVPLAEPTYRDPLRFLDALRAAAARAGAGAAERIAVLQPAGAPNRESVELVAQFAAEGVDAFLADPREVEVRAGRAVFGGRRADLCWNKVNTVTWRAMAEESGLTARWTRVLAGTPLVHVNPFGARYVAENKLALALPRDPRFAGLFTEDERRTVEELLPWSAKVTASARAEDGARQLVDELLDNQVEYVLKEPYDIRGDGVTIGYDVSRSRWRTAVAAAVRCGHLAQRRVRPARYPVVAPGSCRVRTLAISLDTFLLGGDVAGFGSKASANAKVNVFQGGQKLAVHVVGETR